MKTKWFREWGWFYRPVAWPGWLALILTVAFCLQVFTAIKASGAKAPGIEPACAK